MDQRLPASSRHIPQSARVRVPRERGVQIILSGPRKPRRAYNPGVVFVAGFAGLIVVGTALLMLPISAASGEWTPLLDAAFTATSAVAVTGLVVVDTGTHWSLFGQAVIAALFQIGGLGFMTSSTLLLRLIGRRASLRERLLLLESQGGGSVGLALGLARRVLVFTVIAEGIGALILTVAYLESQPLGTAIWWGVFHAISAFNNAGFDLTGGYRSMATFHDVPLVILPLGVLVILGSLSYSVADDVVRNRGFQRLSLDSKLVLAVSAFLLVAGALLLLFTERENGATLGGMPLGIQIQNAFFLSTMARSGGFSTFDLAILTEGSLIVLILLMMIGGSAGSTAGGIKVQTFGILIGATISAIRGLPDVVLFERRVPVPNVLRAIAVALLSFTLVFVVAFVFGLTGQQVFLRELFEVVSAAATVGLSTGLSVEANASGQVLLMVMMFVGRLGPLTLALALAEREHGSPLRWPAESVRIG
jgi:trk system potassium uptake protein TrkH